MKLSDQILRKPFYVAFGQALQGGGITSVDLVAVRDATTVTMTASDGSAAPIAGADTSTAGVMTAADKTKLDGMPTATARDFATKLDVATSVINAGITHLRTAGHSAAGDGGGALYTRVASAPSHALKVQSADGAWWGIVPDNGVLSFQVCGGIEGDNTANGATNVTAFNDFIGYAQQFTLGQPNNTAAVTLFFPKGHYHFNSHLNVKASCSIIGESPTGIVSKAGTKLEFPLDSYGFIFHRKDTIDVTTEADSFDAFGSSIQRLFITGGGATGTTGSGIWLRTPITIKDCYIINFAEDGIRVVAQSVIGDPAKVGNANVWLIDSATCEYNGGNGLFVELNDANAGVCIRGNFIHNGRWGIHEASGLGNTYISCHAAFNGLANDAGNPAGSSSYVSYGGYRYSAHVEASEADLVATTPGTDGAVWILDGSGGSSSTVPLWLAAQAEGTYFHGGAYRTETASNRSVFIGCYRENGEGISQILKPSMTIGGLFADNRGTGVQFNDNKIIGNIVFSNDETNFTDFDRAIDLQFNEKKNNLIRALASGDHIQGLQLLHWDEASGMYIIGMHANLNARRPMWITTDLSTKTYGRASAVQGGSMVFPFGVWIGGTNENNARMHSNGSAAPTTGERARGDIVWNRDVASGAPLGWVCVTAGTPGTWVEIRGVADQTSGANQASLTNSTGGVRDGTLAAVGNTSTVNEGAKINDNFTELHTLLDEVRTTLVNSGLMKGSA